MSVTLDLQIADEGDDHPPPAAIERWVTTTIITVFENAKDSIKPNNHCELTVRIVDRNEITTLNRDYRGKNKATNVLSFPAELPDHIELPLLGDVVICAPIVAQEARDQNKQTQHHWAHMIVHGTLHLLGYDHIDDNDAAVMEGLEINILADLNIQNPYLYSTADE